jgi:hypothetical protein
MFEAIFCEDIELNAIGGNHSSRGRELLPQMVMLYLADKTSKAPNLFELDFVEMALHLLAEVRPGSRRPHKTGIDQASRNDGLD